MTDNTPQKAVDEKYCTDCGKPIKAKAEICPKCGVRQSPASPLGNTTPGGHNRIVAALLAFFLGIVGAHKFYLGRTGQGILYLVFFWTFIPSLISLIEAILYLVSSDEDFARKYG